MIIVWLLFNDNSDVEYTMAERDKRTMYYEYDIFRFASFKCECVHVNVLGNILKQLN